MQLWNLAVLLRFLRRYTTMNSANRRYNLNLNIKGNGTHEYTIKKKKTLDNNNNTERVVNIITHVRDNYVR